jgi:hypothetical protein
MITKPGLVTTVIPKGRTGRHLNGHDRHAGCC